MIEKIAGTLLCVAVGLSFVCFLAAILDWLSWF